MLDCSRHFYLPKFIKKMLDVCALHHLNVFHWHLSDDQGWRFPVDGYPKLIEVGSKRVNPHYPNTAEPKHWESGFYTEDDIRDIVAYAAERHILVIPEVDLPGHTSAALAAYPELGCTGGPYEVEIRYGVMDDILCAGNDAIFDFIEAVFSTLARLFPGPYVHIGGDEAPTTRWEACPKCRARMKALGLSLPRQLQHWLTARFAAMLAKHGKTAVCWDEVLEDSDKATADTALPKNITIMYWRSWLGAKPALQAVEQGLPLVMTPCNHGSYLNFSQTHDPGDAGSHPECSTLHDSYTIPLYYPGMTDEQKKLVRGGQGNLWGELINNDKNAEYLLFPRLCALAEVLWTEESLQNYDDFQKRLQTHLPRLDTLGVLYCRSVEE
jgi:hexosaminidase